MKNFNEILIFLAICLLLFLFCGKKILEGNYVIHDVLKSGEYTLKPWDPKPGAGYDPNEFCNQYDGPACVAIPTKYKCIWKYDSKENSSLMGTCNYNP